MSFGADFKRAHEAGTGFENRHLYAFPFLIRIGDEPALYCTVTAAPNESPLTLNGGIVQIAGRASDGSDKRLVIRLLAALRG